MFWQDFHFVRPWWFLALAPVIALLLLAWRSSRADSPWRKTCDPHLLEHLWLTPPGRMSRGLLGLLAAGWLLAIIALAGPVWERQPQPAFRADMARVIVLDLSPSMNAADVAPSRLLRARFKLSDLLERMREGRAALVVFGGEAHVVTPLTTDTETIATMIPALATDIIPAPGDRAAPALALAQTLLERAGAKTGQVILITDGVADQARAKMLAGRLRRAGFPLSVLAVGTEAGAPVPDGKGGYGSVAKLAPAGLEQLASAGGGAFSRLTPDTADLDRIVRAADARLAERQRAEKDKVERWVERGVWLLPLLLLIAASGMRKGWLGVLLLTVLLPQPSQAMDWQGLWRRDDQQGRYWLKHGQPKRAASLLKDPMWRGAALYAAGDFDAAAAQFAQVNSAKGHYNRGNALARGGHLEAALAAYEATLKLDPNDADARANLELIKALLKKRRKPPRPPQPPKPPPSEGKPPPRPRTPPSPKDDQSGAANREPKPKMPQNEPSAPPRQPGRAHSAALPDKDAEPPEQNLEQWLQQVPDDPSGLLRRKFMLEHLRNKKGVSRR